MDGQEVVRDSAVILYVMIAFLSGGGTVIAAIALLANQILKSPVLVAALENLARSAHPDLLKALNVSAKLVDEVTDEKPYAEKIGGEIAPARTTPPPSIASDLQEFFNKPTDG